MIPGPLVAATVGIAVSMVPIIQAGLTAILLPAAWLLAPNRGADGRRSVMNPSRSSRAAVPQTFFVKLMLPFAVPITVTMALVLAVGERWPRSIAPGSGLKLAAFAPLP